MGDSTSLLFEEKLDILSVDWLHTMSLNTEVQT